MRNSRIPSLGSLVFSLSFALLLLAGCPEKTSLLTDGSPDPFAPLTPSSEDGGALLDAGVRARQDGGRPQLPSDSDAGFTMTPVSPACQTFMDCLLAIDPETPLDPDFVGAFGEGGTCWASGQNIATFCEGQCIEQLIEFQDVADIIPECFYAFGPPADGGPAVDGGVVDGGVLEAGPVDAGAADTGNVDAGTAPNDAGQGLPDAGPPDAGPPDAGPPDAGPPDAGQVDAGATAG